MATLSHQPELVNDHAHSHGDEKDLLSEDNVRIVKIVFIFFNLAVTYFGMLPKVVPACRKNQDFLSIMNCYSGGIFLGMALVHLVPEAEHIYADWAAGECLDNPFPLPHVLMLAGYLFILLCDRVIGGKFHNHEHGHHDFAGISHHHVEMTEVTKVQTSKSKVINDPESARQYGEAVGRPAGEGNTNGDHMKLQDISDRPNTPEEQRQKGSDQESGSS